MQELQRHIDPRHLGPPTDFLHIKNNVNKLFLHMRAINPSLHEFKIHEGLLYQVLS